MAFEYQSAFPPRQGSAEWNNQNGTSASKNGGIRLADSLRERFRQDPMLGIPGMPPNAGEFPVPHIMTLQGLVTNISKVYRVSDEALNDSFDQARFMEYDIGIWECIEARIRSCVLLDWHLEPEDEKDPEQVACVEQLTKILKYTPRFMQLREQLMLAIWYGRSGVQIKPGWDWIGRQPYIKPIQWLPIHGDKIVFRLMDGDLSHRQNQVGIRVGLTYNVGDRIYKGLYDQYGNRKPDHWQIEPTDRGLAYFLTEADEKLLCIHKHQIQDAAFERPIDAGRIHGVGIRNRIYWEWFMKQSTLQWLMEYVERSAFGLELWFYPMHNEKAKADAQAAIKQRVGAFRNVLMVPVPPDDGSGQQYGVQHVETGLAGADLLQGLVEKYFGHRIKRLILGQTLTTEADATGLGSGVASIHLLSFRDIVKYDSVNLQETMTDWINYSIKPWNFPNSSHYRIRFVIETEPVDADEKLTAMEKAWNMGARIKEKDVLDAIGAAAPTPADLILPGPAAMAPPGGAAPGEVPPGAEGGEQGNDDEEEGEEEEEAVAGEEEGQEAVDQQEVANELEEDTPEQFGLLNNRWIAPEVDHDETAQYAEKSFEELGDAFRKAADNRGKLIQKIWSHEDAGRKVPAALSKAHKIAQKAQEDAHQAYLRHPDHPIHKEAKAKKPTGPISGTPHTVEGLEAASKKAGHKLFGKSLEHEGVHGIVQKHISQLKGADRHVNDYEYVFHPSTGKGIDASGDEIGKHLADKDGHVYTYDATDGNIRIISTHPKAKYELEDTAQYAFDPAKHPHAPAGAPGGTGGQFVEHPSSTSHIGFSKKLKLEGILGHFGFPMGSASPSAAKSVVKVPGKTGKQIDVESVEIDPADKKKVMKLGSSWLEDGQSVVDHIMKYAKDHGVSHLFTTLQMKKFKVLNPNGMVNDVIKYPKAKAWKHGQLEFLQKIFPPGTMFKRVSKSGVKLGLVSGKGGGGEFEIYKEAGSKPTGSIESHVAVSLKQTAPDPRNHPGWKKHAANLTSAEESAISSWKSSAYGIRMSVASGKPNATAKAFLSAIEKAPKMEGTYFRGFHGTYADDQMKAIEAAGIGGVWLDNCPMGMSRSPDRSLGFSHGKVLLKCKAKTARAIEPIDGFSGPSSEKEHISPPATKWKIVRVVKKAKVNGKSVEMFIELEEI